MKVLHVFNEINYSGAEVMYANAAPIFQEHGFELFALATGDNIGNYVDEFKKRGIIVLHKPIKAPIVNPLNYIKYVRQVNQIIKQLNIDIVHIHRSGYFLIFGISGFVNNKVVVRTFHNVFKNRKFTWPKAWIQRFVARRFLNVRFQTIGESVYLNELNYYKNPSTKINNWYNETRFYAAVSDEEKKILRSKLQLPLDAFIIISAGSCTNVKNHHDIIRALEIVKKQINCYYVHLGTGVTEWVERDLADKLEVSENILFAGNRTDVRDYMAASDLFVMTSSFEGLSIASIEAMACKLPLLLYNSPGLRDLIEGDDCGFLINADFEIAAEKIVLASKSFELLQAKAANALKKVKESYSMAVNVEKIIELYKI